MPLVKQKTNALYRFQVEKEVGKDASGKQVLDYLFGRYHELPDANFVIRKWPSDDRTPIHRLNTIWVVILTLAVAPFQYVWKGDVGWSTKTKFGTWLLRITGNLNEDGSLK